MVHLVHTHETGRSVSSGVFSLHTRDSLSVDFMENYDEIQFWCISVHCYRFISDTERERGGERQTDR